MRLITIFTHSSSSLCPFVHLSILRYSSKIGDTKLHGDWIHDDQPHAKSIVTGNITFDGPWTPQPLHLRTVLDMSVSDKSKWRTRSKILFPAHEWTHLLPEPTEHPIPLHKKELPSHKPKLSFQNSPSNNDRRELNPLSTEIHKSKSKRFFENNINHRPSIPTNIKNAALKSFH